MQTNIDLEKCLTFINCQLQPSDRPIPHDGEGARWKAVTISRQTGSGGHAVAEKLAELLQAGSPAGAAPWTVFDRNLVEKVLEDHRLPSRMAQFMAEDRMSEISDTLDELFGLHPPSWTLVRNTADTILRLTELGNVILIGRGAHVITSRLHGVFHVRLAGSLERRVAYIRELHGLSLAKARQYVVDQDRGKRRYLKKYFGKDIDDPLQYHLVVNTDLVPYDEAARLIVAAMALCPEATEHPET